MEEEREGLGKPLAIAEITAQVKETLEEGIPPCWIVGEVSDYTHHRSGHRYFTLKDTASQLSCVMFKWQGRMLSFEPEPGMQIMAYGHISIYERGGRYQFYAAQLQPAGVGELALAFARLKERLEEEGLFAEDRKRPLPFIPRTVGVATSPTGAAIRDIIQVIRRRAPGVQIVLCPVRVQGPGAAEEIAQAVKYLNEHSDCDILIVGRGGGSPEDLWPFNEEVVARAIFASACPVISAVGHEIDYTIADYVADMRAPTPSAAAELAVPEEGELARRLADSRRALGAAMQARLKNIDQYLESRRPQRLLLRLQDRMEQTSQYVDERRQALATALDWYLRARVESLATGAVRLEGLNPLGGLARGFAFCQRGQDAQPVRRSGDLQVGEQVKLRFHEGSAICRVEETYNE